MLESITTFVKENKEYFIGAAVGAGVTLGGVGATRWISHSKAKKAIAAESAAIEARLNATANTVANAAQ